MPARAVSRLGPIVAVAILAGGCSAVRGPAEVGSPAAPSSGAPGQGTSGPPPASSLAPATPWEAELRDLGPHGERTATSALRLFAMAFGPLPGVDVPSDPGPIPSGSLAVEEVQAHWTALTRDQQAAIQAALEPPAGSLHAVVGPTSVTGSTPGRPWSLAATVTMPHLPLAVTAAEQQLAALEDATLNLRSQIATKLGGGDGAGPIEVVIPPVKDRAAAGYAVPDFDANDQYVGCTLTVEPTTMAMEPIAILNTVAHEVFHCFEAAGVKTRTAWNAGHAWWKEGGAEWVGDVLGGIDGVSARFWPLWLSAPRNLLFARTYDAEGFFAHIDESGTSPWTVFPRIFNAGDDAAAFAAAIAGNPDPILDGWASSLVRDPNRGPAWDATGPGITDDRVAPEPITIGKSEYEVAASPYSAADFAVKTDEDVLQVVFLGRARISDGETDTGSIVSAQFCLKAGGCPDTCPDGSPLPGSIPVLHQPFILALTGGAGGTQGTLQGSSLEDFCQKPAAAAVQVKEVLNEFGTQITRVDLVSCDGPYGHWSGVIYGIATYNRPMSFDVGGSGDRTVTVTPADANLPDNLISVSGDVDVTIQDGGTTMVLSGTTIAVFRGPNGPLPPDRTPFSLAYQITPADPGRCP